MKREMDERKRPAVWHLIWFVPLSVAIVLGIWDYLEVHYMTDLEGDTLQFIHLIRGVIIAFVVTTVAVYMVLRDQRKHEEKLEKTLAELRELDDMKNNFLSNVSHELRTPLTTINGYVKFMLSKKPGELTEKQRKYLRIMSEECDRLQHHIEELLFITTLESKPMVLKIEEVDLFELSGKIENNMKVKAGQKALTIRFEVEKGLTMITDRARLIQLFTNLVDNSIKYTDEGGKVLFRIRGTQKDINIQVMDSGIGIPSDKQEKVFERFYQIDAKVSREYGGTGLGLAICREVVRTSGGRVRIVSPLTKQELKALGLKTTEGIKGTMFDIHLPKEADEVEISYG